MRHTHRGALATLGVVVMALGCKGTKSDGASSTAAVTAASAPPIDTRPTRLPALGTLLPKQTVDLGPDAYSFELCRLDAAAPPLEGKEVSKAKVSLASAPDGSLYVLDQDKKLRHYTLRTPSSCDLLLDKSFGDAGILEPRDASGKNTTFSVVSVDAKGTVYLSSWGGPTMKIAEGKLVPHCSGGPLLAQASSKTTVVGGTIVADGQCAGAASVSSLKGFDDKAPAYASPKALGFFGDEVVVRGTDMLGKREIEKVGLYDTRGVQRLKLGKPEGDERIWGSKLGTKCGDDLCLFSAMFLDAGVKRFKRDGSFVKYARLSFTDVQEIDFASAGDGDVWIGGVAPGNEKGAYSGVILRARKASPGSVVRGTLRGLPLVALKTDIAYGNGSWRLSVHSPTGSHLTTTLMAVPAAGVTSRADKAGPKRSSSNEYLDPSDTPDKRSSDRIGDTDHHEITFKTWAAAPFDAKKAPFPQTAGYASGHLTITLGSGPDATQVSGDFEDAPIILKDDPAAPQKD